MRRRFLSRAARGETRYEHRSPPSDANRPMSPPVSAPRSVQSRDERASGLCACIRALGEELLRRERAGCAPPSRPEKRRMERGERTESRAPGRLQLCFTFTKLKAEAFNYYLDPGPHSKYTHANGRLESVPGDAGWEAGWGNIT